MLYIFSFEPEATGWLLVSCLQLTRVSQTLSFSVRQKTSPFIPPWCHAEFLAPHSVQSKIHYIQWNACFGHQPGVFSEKNPLSCRFVRHITPGMNISAATRLMEQKVIRQTISSFHSLLVLVAWITPHQKDVDGKLQNSMQCRWKSSNSLTERWGDLVCQGNEIRNCDSLLLDSEHECLWTMVFSWQKSAWRKEQARSQHIWDHSKAPRVPKPVQFNQVFTWTPPDCRLRMSWSPSWTQVHQLVPLESVGADGKRSFRLGDQSWEGIIPFLFRVLGRKGVQKTWWIFYNLESQMALIFNFVCSSFLFEKATNIATEACQLRIEWWHLNHFPNQKYSYRTRASLFVAMPIRSTWNGNSTRSPHFSDQWRKLQATPKVWIPCRLTLQINAVGMIYMSKTFFFFLKHRFLPLNPKK